MAKKISVFRENDAKYFKEYLMEAVRETIEELSEEEIVSEANLSFAELAKSPQRLQAFIAKIEKGEPFELAGGGEVVLEKDPQVIAAFKKMLETGEVSSAAAQEAVGTSNI